MYNINVLNCSTKNFEPCKLIHNFKLVRCNIERTETADILLSIYDLFYCLRPWYVVIGFDMEVQPLVTHNAA